MDDLFRFTPGTTPLLVSVPHDGQNVPDALAAGMTEAARRLPDTDWHINRLYDFAAGLGASVLSAVQSRYVVDLNRDPSGSALYPGADNTEVVPTMTFDREPIYRDGDVPDVAQVAARVAQYWQPYHDRLQQELAALKRRYGFALLFDAHSIRSRVPRFFEGTLPDFNFGTAAGGSADSGLAARAYAVLDGAEGFTAVDNGRFTGGYITRTYGRPDDNVHAIQLELAQCTYMEEGFPFDFDETRADRVRPVLKRLLEEILEWAAEQA